MNSQLKDLKEPIHTVERAMNVTIDDDSMDGEAAQSIKNFFRNSHLPLIRYWDTSINKGENMIMSVRNAANSFDSHPNAYVSEAFIEGEIMPQLEKLKQDVAESTDNVNAIIDEVSDIVSIPRLDDSRIQAGIDRAKKHAQITIENLYEFDYKANASMLKYAEILNPLKNYISDLMSAVESGINSQSALTAVTLSTDMPEEILALHDNPKQMRTVLTAYDVFKEQSPQIAMSMAMNPMGAVQWLNPYAYGVAKRMFLASGNIDVVNHYSPSQQVKGMSVDAGGNVVTSANGDEIGGEIINDWGNGHIEAKGGNIDIQELKDAGVRVQTFTTVNGKELHYTVENGEFILFRHEPETHYYTNGYTQTRSNVVLAHGAMFVGGILTYSIGKSISRGEYKGNVKKDNTVVMEVKKDKTIFDFAKEKGKSFLLGTLPIIGTSMPKTGSQEIIVWLSDDEGENWDTKVHVEVDPNGEVKMGDYEERKNFIDKAVDFFTK